MMANNTDSQRSSSLGRTITRVSLRLQYDLSQRALQRIIISPSQKAVLINLEDAGNRISVLAKRLRISKQATSKLVQELEAKGLLERYPDPSDNRASIIEFSSKGRRVVTDTLSYFMELENMLSEAIGPEELKLLKDKMKLVADLLDPEGF